MTRITRLLAAGTKLLALLTRIQSKGYRAAWRESGKSGSAYNAYQQSVLNARQKTNKQLDDIYDQHTLRVAQDGVEDLVRCVEMYPQFIKLCELHESFAWNAMLANLRGPRGVVERLHDMTRTAKALLVDARVRMETKTLADTGKGSDR